VLVWRDGASEVTSFWQPPAHTPRVAGNEAQTALELRELLEESVRGRLLADVPVGLFLSGGVDSTLVGALAHRVSGGALQTFSVDYDIGAVGEKDEARAAARVIGAQHHELVLSEADVAARAPRALGMLDQPLADPAFVALQALSDFAREHVKVAVGGEGADELFGGYPRYHWLSRASRLAERAGATGRAAASTARRGRVGRLASALVGADPFAVHLDWVTAGRSAWRPTVYGPRLQGLADRDGRPAQLRARVGDAGHDLASALMRLDQLVWLADDVLVKADRASMQASLELRTPYLSRELAEFAATIPAAAHVGGGGKRLLRDALRHELPRAEYRRRKVAFRVPNAEWLRGPLAPALAEQLEGNALYEQGWFERGTVRGLLREHVEGTDRSAVLWPLFALGAWFDGGGGVYA
jgi:asparagine synthase (glutamine-hydrolysing)